MKLCPGNSTAFIAVQLQPGQPASMAVAKRPLQQCSESSFSLSHVWGRCNDRLAGWWMPRSGVYFPRTKMAGRFWMSGFDCLQWAMLWVLMNSVSRVRSQAMHSLV